MSASPPSWERTERRAGNDELLQRLRVFHMLSRDQLAQVPFLTEGAGCALHGDVAERLRSFIQGFHAKAVCLGGMHPDPVLHGPNLGANDRVYVTPDADVSHAVGLRDTPPQVTDLQKVQRRTYQGVDDGVVLDVYTVHGGARHALCHLRRGATRAETRAARLTQSFDAEFSVRGYDTDFGVDAAPQQPPSPPRTTSYSTTRSFYYTPHSAQTPHSSQTPAPAPASSLRRAPPSGRSVRLSAAPSFASAAAGPASGGERDIRSLSPPRTRGAAGGLPTFPSTPGRTGGGVVSTAVTTSSRAGTLDGPLSQKTEFLYDLIDGRRTMADQTLPPCPHAMMCPLVSDREHLDTHSHPCPRYFETSECHLRSEASHARYFSHGERRAAASPPQRRPSSPPLWDTTADGLHKDAAVARGRAPTRAADASGTGPSPSRVTRARHAQTPSPPPLPLQHPPIPSPLPQQPPQHPVPTSSVPSFVSVPQPQPEPQPQAQTRLVGATSFNTQPIRLEPAPSPAPAAAAAAAPPSPPQSAASHRERNTSPASLRGPLDVPEPDWRDLFQATLVEFAQSPKPPQPSWSAGAPAPAAVPAQPSYVDSADAEAVLRAGFDVFPSAAEMHYHETQHPPQHQHQHQQRQHEHGRHVAPAYKQSRVSWVRSTSGSRSRSKSKSAAFTYANCKPGIPEPSNRPPGAVVRRSQLSPAAARRKPASSHHHTPTAAAAAPPAEARSSSAARRRPSPAAARAKRLPAPPATPAPFTPAPKKTATPKAAPAARKPAAASAPAAAAVPSALKKPRAEAPAAQNKSAAAPLSTPSAAGYKPAYSAKETVAAKERLFGAGGSSSSAVSGPSYKPTPKRVDSVSAVEAPAKRRTVIIDGAEVDAEEADRAIARIQATFRGKKVRASMSPPPSQAPPLAPPVVPPPAVEPSSAPNAEEGEDEIAAATRIQALYRGRKGRQSASPLREERRQLGVAEMGAAPARQATPVSEVGQDLVSGAATDDENDEKGRTRNTSTAESSSSSSTPQKKSLSSSDSDSS